MHTQTFSQPGPEEQSKQTGGRISHSTGDLRAALSLILHRLFTAGTQRLPETVTKTTYMLRSDMIRLEAHAQKAFTWQM